MTYCYYKSLNLQPDKPYSMKLSLNRRWLALAVFSLFTTTAFSQAINLTQTPNASVCTGDSLTITFNITPGFAANNHFDVLMTPGLAATADFTDPATMDLPIAKWFPSGGIPAVDTNDAGIKQVTIIIPETITTNGNYSIRVDGDNPVVNSNIFEVAVNVTIPASIDSIKGGFKNIYTPADTSDWGRCLTDTMVLYANPGFNYQWYVNGAPVRSIQIGRTDDRYDSLVVYAQGDYYVEVSSGPVCPGESKHVLINNYIPQPITNFVNPMNIEQPWVEILDHPTNLLIDSVQFCESDSVMLFGLAPVIPGEVFSYQWYKDSLTFFGLDTIVPIKGASNDTFAVTRDIMAGSINPFEIEIYLEVTEVNTGCVTLQQFPKWVFMDTIPDANISAIPWNAGGPAPTTLCIEDSIRLRSDVIGGPDWEYQWQVQYPLSSTSWQNFPADTLPTIRIDTGLIPDSARYRLVINNLTCTYITNVIQINIVPNPVFQFLPSDSVAVCAGDSVLVAVNGNGQQYTWSDGFIGSSRYLSNPGTYWVDAQGVNQCHTFDTLILYPLVVNANAGPDQTINEDEDAVMAASGGVTYYWYADQPVYFSNPRDPNTRTRPVKDTTKYYVEVTAANGCTAIDSMMLYIADPFAGNPNLSNVQNVMTPNGDGINDVLSLQEVIGTDGCDLTILNRWGAEVYYEENYSNGWSGVNAGGDDLPDGTYYFMLTCGDEVRFRGAITLIRNND